ncbi:MAG: exopolysaccharide biosynthesis protein [Bdellovibrionaceae bacterium]|nr:exopolysaccharide biosynthesis protein [Pseudobdellovibrionaceae bacterium]
MAKSHFVEALEKITAASESSDVTINDIFVMLGEKGHLILILFFSVPFLQPVPLLGLSTPLGALIVIVAFYFMREKPPWLPKRFSHLVVSKPILNKTIEMIQKIWGYLEKVLEPRWGILHDSHTFRVINFLLVAASATLLALPLPIPFSNTIPTVPIVLNTIGQLEEDGVIIFLSFFSFLFSIIFFTSLGAGVFIGIDKYSDKLLPLFGF